jgi:hypothetical protein
MEVPTQRDEVSSLKHVCGLPWNFLCHKLCFTRSGKVNNAEKGKYVILGVNKVYDLTKGGI